MDRLVIGGYDSLQPVEQSVKDGGSAPEVAMLTNLLSFVLELADDRNFILGF